MKSGSDVTQIQRKLNRDSFDVNRITITNISNGHEKERKSTILNKKNYMLNRRYPKASPDVDKGIRTLNFKTNPSTKRDIANEIRFRIGTLYL